MNAIKTRYLCATDTKGSRIVADDGDGNRWTVPYRSEFDSEANHAAAALALCARMGWTGKLIPGNLGDGYVFVWLKESTRPILAVGIDRELA